MPCLHVEWNVLGDGAMTVYQQMRRDAQMGNLSEVTVLQRIQPIAEQLINVPAAELSRWQTDIVNHQQVNRHAIGASTAIGRSDLAGETKTMVDDQDGLR